MEPQQNEVEDVIAPHKKVTPLSKYLAMALFIVLPFLGGWIGYKYAPEKVWEVEKVVVVETDINNGDTILFKSKDGVYSFRYPTAWRFTDVGTYIQIENYPEPTDDEPGWGIGHNKIEGGKIIETKDISEWNSFVTSEIALMRVYLLKGGYDGSWNWMRIAIPLPEDSSKVVSFIVYGDMDNFNVMAETLLTDFTFTE